MNSVNYFHWIHIHFFILQCCHIFHFCISFSFYEVDKLFVEGMTRMNLVLFKRFVSCFSSIHWFHNVVTSVILAQCEKICHWQNVYSHFENVSNSDVTRSFKNIKIYCFIYALKKKSFCLPSNFHHFIIIINFTIIISRMLHP